jgi:hypothetical protein
VKMISMTLCEKLNKENFWVMEKKQLLVNLK